MPKDANFINQFLPKIKEFRIEDANLFVGEGIPRLEFLLSHIMAEHRLMLVITPGVQSKTETRNDAGIDRVLVISTPAISMRVQEVKEENKKEPA